MSDENSPIFLSEKSVGIGSYIFYLDDLDAKEETAGVHLKSY
mgnify:FL=1